MVFNSRDYKWKILVSDVLKPTYLTLCSVTDIVKVLQLYNLQIQLRRRFNAFGKSIPMGPRHSGQSAIAYARA